MPSISLSLSLSFSGFIDDILRFHRLLHILRARSESFSRFPLVPEAPDKMHIVRELVAIMIMAALLARERESAGV